MENFKVVVAVSIFHIDEVLVIILKRLDPTPIFLDVEFAIFEQNIPQRF